MSDELLPELFDALNFAAEKHQYQRRGGYDRLPYINHLIKVAEALIRIGGERDRNLLLAAILHDVVEDSPVTHAELADRYGARVADIVLELTDDMSLPHKKRKQLQIERAGQLSPEARRIRLVDKACNIRDIFTYPLSWNAEKKRNYVINAVAIVDRLRGPNPQLEAWFDETVRWAREKISRP